MLQLYSQKAVTLRLTRGDFEKCIDFGRPFTLYRDPMGA